MKEIRQPLLKATLMNNETDDSSFYYQLDIVSNEKEDYEWAEIVCPYGHVKSFFSVSEAKKFFEELLTEDED